MSKRYICARDDLHNERRQTKWENKTKEKTIAPHLLRIWYFVKVGHLNTTHLTLCFKWLKYILESNESIEALFYLKYHSLWVLKYSFEYLFSKFRRYKTLKWAWQNFIVTLRDIIENIGLEAILEGWHFSNNRFSMNICHL